MARVTVIVCDRCDTRLGEGEAVLATVRGPARADGGRLRREVDLCDDCARRVIAVATASTRGRLPAIELEAIAEAEAERQLAEVRRRAAAAVDGWNGGDGCDALLEALRDVASGARRVAA